MCKKERLRSSLSMQKEWDLCDSSNFFLYFKVPETEFKRFKPSFFSSFTLWHEFNSTVNNQVSQKQKWIMWQKGMTIIYAQKQAFVQQLVRHSKKWSRQAIASVLNVLFHDRLQGTLWNTQPWQQPSRDQTRAKRSEVDKYPRQSLSHTLSNGRRCSVWGDRLSRSHQ